MSEWEAVLQRIDQLEGAVLEELRRERKQPQPECYTTAQFAELTGRATFTVQQWCRDGRIKADKKRTGCGRSFEWAIPTAELGRYQKEGLLPTEQSTRRLDHGR